MLLVEVYECLSNLYAFRQWLVVQRLIAASRKIVVWMVFAGQFPVQLEHAPLIALQVLLVLRVYGAQLAVECVFKEKRVDEELGETVESAIQRRAGLGDWQACSAAVGGA